MKAAAEHGNARRRRERSGLWSGVHFARQEIYPTWGRASTLGLILAVSRNRSGSAPIPERGATLRGTHPARGMAAPSGLSQKRATEPTGAPIFGL